MKNTFLILLLLLASTICHAEKRERRSRQPHPPKNQTRTNFIGYHIVIVTPGSETEESLQEHDGYVVYAADTVRGNFKFSNDTISVTAKNGKCSVFLWDDSLLRSFLLYSKWSTAEIFVTRVPEYDNSLMRLVHQGRLNMYDENFLFPLDENIQLSDLKLVANGRPYSHKVALDPRKSIIKMINKVYNENLKPEAYNSDVMVLYHIRGLDKQP
jgi:hypothetical protein